MCSTCGCDHPEASLRIVSPAHALDLSPLISPHPHPHPTPAPPTTSRRIAVARDILAENDLLAAHNRGWFAGRRILALNLVSSPGSGKTSLLEHTLRALGDIHPCYVIEGDQQSQRDGDRIAATGAPVVQINTGHGCHLDAGMVQRALAQLNPVPGALLFIENVGNLVCPALFDLGESARILVMSVTEGDDKPLKYPDMFASAQLCLINKVDLLPYVDFDPEQAMAYARQVNPDLTFIMVSATSGHGLEAWYQWLAKQAPDGLPGAVLSRQNA